MDPTACLKLISTALRDNDLEEAQEHAENLCQWLRKGGFAPDDLTREEAFNLANDIANAEDLSQAHEVWNAIIANRPTEE